MWRQWTPSFKPNCGSVTATLHVVYTFPLPPLNISPNPNLKYKTHTPYKPLRHNQNPPSPSTLHQPLEDCVCPARLTSPQIVAAWVQFSTVDSRCKSYAAVTACKYKATTFSKGHCSNPLTFPKCKARVSPALPSTN